MTLTSFTVWVRLYSELNVLCINENIGVHSLVWYECSPPEFSGNAVVSCYDSGELTPELERQQQQYEDWLMKHGNYLDMQVKQLEQQIGKCKRTKKAINARNRQVSRNRSSDGVFIYSLSFDV